MKPTDSTGITPKAPNPQVPLGNTSSGVQEEHLPLPGSEMLTVNPDKLDELPSRVTVAPPKELLDGQPNNEDDLVVKQAKETLHRWAETKDIPSHRLTRIEPLKSDDKHLDLLLKSLSWCGVLALYIPLTDTIYLDTESIRKGTFNLKKFVPHEGTHGDSGAKRTRLYIHHKDLFKKTVIDHLVDRITNGDLGYMPRFSLEPKSSDPIKTFMTAPELLSMRPKMVAFIRPIVEDPEKFIQAEEAGSLALNTKTLDEIRALVLNHEDYISQYMYHNELGHEENRKLAIEEGVSELADYILAQFARILGLEYLNLIPEDVRPEWFNEPMTDKKEIEEAKLYLREVSLTAYSILAFEEVLAETNAARFQLDEIKEDQNPAAASFRQSLNADIEMGDLSNKYVEVMRNLAVAPKGIEVLKEMNALKAKLKELFGKYREIRQVEEDKVDVKALDIEKKQNLAFALAVDPKVQQIKKEIIEMEDKLYDKYALKYRLAKTPENEILLKDLDIVIQEMRKFAPICTVRSLPGFVFSSEEERERQRDLVTLSYNAV